MPAQPDTKQIAALLAALPEILHAEFDALDENALGWHPAPGEWCAKEVLGHIIEADRRGFAGRVRQFLDEDNPQCIAWDPPQVAAERDDCNRAASDLLNEFAALRADGVSAILALQPEQLSRSGMPPAVGTLTISDLLFEWIHHDQNHVKQIMSNIQEYVWPHMGNAQNFSQID